ncbi:hypothetical protein [Plasmodium yoelii yoelii]|uniref:Uncharacterized protein n=1 Tax=Plasmodium yoelii yoelii TaxID=73239 RepID=Q7RHV3_PLAYO|nr:hypothetical protein [Plasmodium yoelii yoelii]
MIFNKYKKKVKNTKREYCDVPEDDNKEKTVLSDVVTNENNSGLYDDCQITTNFISFTKNFNKNVYILFSEFLESFRNKFFTIILVPINTPIKVLNNLSKKLNI